jgi:hypothetical protein
LRDSQTIEEHENGKGMMYEVPDNLKYEERIFWAFTARQLAIFSVFAIVALVIFTDSGIDLRVRLASCGAVCALGFAFSTFQPLQDELEKRVKYLWAPKAASWTQQEAINRFIRVKSVKGREVLLQDGRSLAILLVTPVDFSVLSDSQKRSLLSGYRQFLNSLTFPIQILARTTRLDLQAYFAGAKAAAASARNQAALKEIERFEEFVQDYVGRKGVHDRLFYIVIPQDSGPDTPERQRLLEYKSEICIEKLAAAGIMARRLEEGQLISLYASFFGGHLETDADYLSIVSLLQLSEEEKTERNARGNEE